MSQPSTKITLASLVAEHKFSQSDQLTKDVTAMMEVKGKADKRSLEAIFSKVNKLSIEDLEPKDKFQYITTNFGEVYLPIFASLESLELKRREKEATKASLTWLWITINPKIDDLGSLISCTEKCVDKIWVTDYFYVYEQRANYSDYVDHGAQPYGYHVHMILNRPEGKPISHTNREVKNPFSKLPSMSSKAITITCVSDEERNQKISYMMGNKSSADKLDKCKLDSCWRVNNGLSDYYSSDDTEVEYIDEPVSDSQVESTKAYSQL